jgi:hypothetical protein
VPNLLLSDDFGPEQTPLARIVFRSELRLREIVRALETLALWSTKTMVWQERSWEAKATDQAEDELKLRAEYSAAAFFGPGVRADVVLAPDNSIEIAACSRRSERSVCIGATLRTFSGLPRM